MVGQSERKKVLCRILNETIDTKQHGNGFSHKWISRQTQRKDNRYKKKQITGYWILNTPTHWNGGFLLLLLLMLCLLNFLIPAFIAGDRFTFYFSNNGKMDYEWPTYFVYISYSLIVCPPGTVQNDKCVCVCFFVNTKKSISSFVFFLVHFNGKQKSIRSFLLRHLFLFRI